MTLLIVGIILFLGVHLVRVVAPDFRRSMIASLGERGWRAGYSIASILTLVLLIYGFGQARGVTGMLYNPPVWTAHIAITLMLIAMICLVASLLPAGHIATKTKHPMVLSVKIWALAHLLANGETSSVLLFGAFLAWGVIVRISLKRRERAGDTTLRPFVSAKSDLYAAVIGIVAWALIIWKLHEWLIGVSPLVV
ncbi:NnrU family protein [Rhizobium lentis]|uniref:NnrU family protein n=1 Tax=Rhizobium lentis TaxID=1138194 RepID=UPI001C82F6B5|nr:NnrU family protein [Rhizobium lentis]MBX5011741.1 NnrU family protein [Rhizobium lentis]MBX5040106.1 NnrU family protein [Rhizobium lentis]MBX5053067.1 NnrU family protein [Rhizobium lentis]MBX5069729.1 NnrU family protein [Rhizobium lentis]MBX5107994.1 NnrU family protein [Rhizobium lentis]